MGLHYALSVVHRLAFLDDQCIEFRDISDYLNGRTDDLEGIICHGEEYGLVKGFDVLPIGTMLPNPTELLFTDRLEKIIKYISGATLTISRNLLEIVEN